MFKYATGWLGWTPEIALNTPVPQILLALDGRIDFLKKTNPWGSSSEDEKAKEELPPEEAASGVAALLRGHVNYRGKPVNGS